MAFFVSRPVSVQLYWNLGLPADICADVYSYNFPDDKRATKFLGKYEKSFLKQNDPYL